MDKTSPFPPSCSRLFASPKTGLVLLALLLGQMALAQTQRRWGVAPSTGTIFAHSKDVENTKGSRPWGVTVEYAWQHLDSAAYRKFFGLPTQGIHFSAFNYDNAILCNGYTLAYFIEPEIRFGKKAGLAFRASAGFSYLTNPYDPLSNPTNNSYSTHLSAYLDLGFRPYVQLSNQWQLSLAANYRHVSNAGVKLPNKGINWITGELVLQHYLQPKKDVQAILKGYKSQPWKKQHRLDLYAFAANRAITNESNVKYGVFGLGLNRVWQTGKTHALTVGGEVYQDFATAAQMEADSLGGRSAVRAGLLLGHEFLWGKVRFSQQLGIYLFDQSPYYPGWYHRWGLLYAFHPRWAAGVVLKAHRQVAAFPDLRLVYSMAR